MISCQTTDRRPASLLRDRPGVALLMTMIMIGALVLAIGLSVAFFTQTQVIISGHIDYAQSLRQAAYACVDEAFHRLKSEPAYAGGSLTLGTASCTSVVSGSGLNRTLVVTANEASYALKVTAEATLRENSTGNATGWEVLSWRETNP
jgi:hypothetical protein